MDADVTTDSDSTRSMTQITNVVVHRRRS